MERGGTFCVSIWNVNFLRYLLRMRRSNMGRIPPSLLFGNQEVTRVAGTILIAVLPNREDISSCSIRADSLFATETTTPLDLFFLTSSCLYLLINVDRTHLWVKEQVTYRTEFLLAFSFPLLSSPSSPSGSDSKAQVALLTVISLGWKERVQFYLMLSVGWLDKCRVD